MWLAEAIFCWAVIAPPAGATIVFPTSFEQLTDKADLVFAGKVLTNQSAWKTLQGRRTIVTRVDFQVLEAYKGTAGARLELEFLGGTVGDTRLEVEGTPEFRGGEKVLLFVRTQARASCPVVSYYHGKISIQPDPAGGAEKLVRHDGKVLNDLSEIGAGDPGPTGVPKRLTAGDGHSQLKLEDLKTAIRDRLRSKASSAGAF